MQNILVLIFGVMLTASCGGGGGSNPFDSSAHEETSEQDQNTNTNTNTNIDSGGGTNLSISSISFGGTTPPNDGSSVVTKQKLINLLLGIMEQSAILGTNWLQMTRQPQRMMNITFI